MDLTDTERALVNGWQKGFPLSPRPYERIARELGLSEDDILAMLASLNERGVLSRVGAVVSPNRVGASSLVAMAVPSEKLDDVAAMVSAHPEVNHNYERENRLNLWFVVTTSDAATLDQILRQIEGETGIETVKLPLEKAYHIDLGFAI